MQTLPKSRPKSLDDLVVEVAIIRPGPIRATPSTRSCGGSGARTVTPAPEPRARAQGFDGRDPLPGAGDAHRHRGRGFHAGQSDGFRRAMGTWRSSREMEKLHRQFVDSCLLQPGMTDEMAEELFRQVAAFASFGFAKSHAAAFARTAYESSFLKLFYPAQFLVGLINAQPMGFSRSRSWSTTRSATGLPSCRWTSTHPTYKTTTEWVGRPGEPLPEGAGITGRPEPIRSPACVIPSAAARDRWTPEVTAGWGVRLGLGLVKGIGEQHEELLDQGAGARAVRVAGRGGGADRAPRRGPGTAHPDRRPGFAGAAAAGTVVAVARGGRRVTRSRGRQDVARPGSRGREAGRRRRATDGPAASRHRGAGTPRRSPSRSGLAIPTRSSGWMRDVRS